MFSKFLSITFASLLICSNVFGTNYRIHHKSTLDKWKEELIDEALKARNQAYAPYSKYLVGAALKTTNGKIYHGCNVENASYGLTCCAERSAIFAAVSDGEQKFKAMAIVTKDGGSPCGACRQVLNEFNPKMLILTSNESGTEVFEFQLSEYLPEAFGPKNLK